MRISDVMTAPVVTAPVEASVGDVAELMRDRNVGSVVIVEGDRAIGLLTDRDLAIAVVADGVDPAERAGDLQLAQQMTAEVAKAALPEFFFHQRGG